VSTASETAGRVVPPSAGAGLLAQPAREVPQASALLPARGDRPRLRAVPVRVGPALRVHAGGRSLLEPAAVHPHSPTLDNFKQAFQAEFFRRRCSTPPSLPAA
jgi:hypothetical protein